VACSARFSAAVAGDPLQSSDRPLKRLNDAAQRNGASYRAVGIALAFVGAALFSLKGVTTKLIYEYRADAVTLLALRMLFSVPFFLLAAAWSGRSGAAAPLSRRDLKLVLILGLLGYYLSSFLDFLGLLYISATLERLTLYLYPTLVLLLSVGFLKARARGVDVAAIILSYAGIALVFLSAGRLGGSNLQLGAALVFGSAFAYAIYLVAGTEVIRRIGSMRFTAYAMTVSSIAGILQFVALRPFDALVLPMPAYGWLAVLAIFHTVLPVFMIGEALKRIGATRFAVIGAVGPITTMAVDWLVLGEALNGAQIFGAALVLSGVLLVTLKPKT
jgi:drug/metabolite transporter (DMT)-like permease